VTTICYANGVMSGDGLMTLGDMIIKEDTQKVFWVNNHLCGICGRARAINTFVEWLQKHTDYSIVNQQVGDLVDLIPPQLEDDDGYSALVVTPDKQVLLYEGNTPIMMGTDVPMSIGSGSCFALAAMKAGSSAEEAVKVAMSLDVYSGGTISTVALEEEPEELTREAAEQMDKETLLKVLFGEEEESEETPEEVSEQDDAPYEMHFGDYSFSTVDGKTFMLNHDRNLVWELYDSKFNIRDFEDISDWKKLAESLGVKGDVRHAKTKQVIIEKLNEYLENFKKDVRDNIPNF